MYAAFGEQHTLRKWAQKYGLHVSTVSDRMKSGMTLEQALTQKREPKLRKVIWRGDRISIRDLAQQTGVPYSRLIDRLNAGWTVEDAVNKPKSNRGPKGKSHEQSIGNTVGKP